MSYHNLIVDIKNCKTERELLQVVKHIMSNQKKLRLDDSDMERLESIGMTRLEQIQRDRSFIIKNKKQGFNNFEE